MIQINDLEIIKANRILLKVNEMTLEDSSLNVVYGGEKSGKSLLTNTLHGFHLTYRGLIDFNNHTKQKAITYLLNKDIHLLSKSTVYDNYLGDSKKYLEAIGEYSFIADLEKNLETKVEDLTDDKQRLVELVIACGLNPLLLLIDDFDQCYSPTILPIVGKILMKYKTNSGCVLFTSQKKIPDLDASYSIENGEVIKL
ncbi:MAG: ATP-binding cassette domain-containing protein [Candidatus Cloacimonadales bacterium]